MTDLASYQDLIARKRVAFEPRGLTRVPTLNAAMFPHQAHTTKFLLRAGCGAAFLDTGLGKSLVALEWGRVVAEHANKPVLMLAPLAVGPQHAREAEKFGIHAEYHREMPVGALPPIVITNYERLEKFDIDRFVGVILDESSILKSFTGATTRKLIEAFNRIPFRLACTATPAPNDHMELGNHSQFLIRHKLRVLKPGRLTAVHCTDLPSRKGRDGFIGVKPFSDDIVRAHIDAGFIFHCRVTVWRDPVVEMQRTKALGLLYKQIKKDSCMSRTGLPDYLLVFRKPGDNPERVGHDEQDFPVDQWQQWASPVWMDIRQGNVLNVRMAREGEDERHLCPLQLDLIERAIRLWSNPGDVVLSPFMGIGSEGVTAIKTGRKYVGVELKESYFRQAVRYLVDAEAAASVGTLFGATA